MTIPLQTEAGLFGYAEGEEKELPEAIKQDNNRKMCKQLGFGDAELDWLLAKLRPYNENMKRIERHEWEQMTKDFNAKFGRNVGDLREEGQKVRCIDLGHPLRKKSGDPVVASRYVAAEIKNLEHEINMGRRRALEERENAVIVGPDDVARPAVYITMEVFQELAERWSEITLHPRKASAIRTKCAEMCKQRGWDLCTTWPPGDRYSKVHKKHK